MVAWGISQLMDATGTNKAQRNLRDRVGIVRQWLVYRLIAAPQECVASAARETRTDCCITRIFRGTMPQKVPLQEKWEQLQKWQKKATTRPPDTPNPSSSLESQAIASLIAANDSGCLTAISIDCRARMPVLPLAKSGSSASWMPCSGCLPEPVPAASGGANHQAAVCRY